MKKTLLALLLSFFALVAFAQGIADGSGGFSDNQDDYLQQPSISIYPNPATHFISVNEDKNIKQIVVFNLVGRRLTAFNDIHKDQRYDVSDLPKGMYLVQIINQSNKIITTQRISKR